MTQRLFTSNILPNSLLCSILGYFIVDIWVIHCLTPQSLCLHFFFLIPVKKYISFFGASTLANDASSLTKASVLTSVKSQGILPLPLVQRAKSIVFARTSTARSPCPAHRISFSWAFLTTVQRIGLSWLKAGRGAPLLQDKIEESFNTFLSRQNK